MFSSSCYCGSTFRSSGHSTSSVCAPAFLDASHAAQQRRCKGQRFDLVHRFNNHRCCRGCRGTWSNEVGIHVRPCPPMFGFLTTLDCRELHVLIQLCSVVLTSFPSGILPKMNETFSCKRVRAWILDVRLQTLSREGTGCMALFAAQNHARTRDFEVYGPSSLFLSAHSYRFSGWGCCLCTRSVW